MNQPIEFSNKRAGGRVIETTEGLRIADLRSLGCPDEIAEHVERSQAAKSGAVSDPEFEYAKALLDSLE